ncbi:helix-turn-helix transcriptional regulator [Fulvivirga sp. 29W222]|uniref:Helix-turn-helix transcriptional regulator n=1 Tax=Fulvivirga marina TaxID=2494733 RepID=A0A937KCN8_9BACT|nr:helix-turn-helix transcriptional regulator [Fulvivirga marina]MBL6447589.1 helix-turn-helix transcriptional regulator [Fulvivirga marina]
MKNTNISDNVRKLRKDNGLSLLEFANRINEYLGEDLYSKDAIFRMEKGGAKIPAEFIFQLSEAFNVTIERLYYGEREFTMDELENNPEHGITSDSYKYFIAYAKNSIADIDKPITKEMLTKFEQAVEDMEKVLKNNIELRAKVDYCTFFMKSYLKQ